MESKVNGFFRFDEFSMFDQLNYMSIVGGGWVLQTAVHNIILIIELNWVWGCDGIDQEPRICGINFLTSSSFTNTETSKHTCSSKTQTHGHLNYVHFV